MLPEFDYHNPQSLQEALILLDEYKRNARILAGGTDLIVTLRARQENPGHVIDVKQVKELRNLTFEEPGELRIGAAVSLNQLVHYDVTLKAYAVLAQAAGTIGDYEVRNRGTLVGNICNASPAADSAPALLVLDATVNIASKLGSRKVPIREFFKGVKKTTLASNEMVTSVTVPIPPMGSRGCYMKARRTMGEDLAMVGVAGLVTPDTKSGRKVRLAYASVAPTPVRVFDAEKIFEKKKPIDQLLDEAIPVIAKSVSPISDVRAGKEYRSNLVRVLTKRLLRSLWEAG